MASARLSALLAALILIVATTLPASAQTEEPIGPPTPPTPTPGPTAIPTDACTPDRITHDGPAITSHLVCPDGSLRKLVTYYAEDSVQFQYLEYRASSGELLFTQWTRYDPRATPPLQVLARSDDP